MARTRLGMALRLAAGATAVGIVVGLTPQPAWAAVTVKAWLDASIQISLPSCTEFVFVYTGATFSPPASADEVRVSFQGAGAPAGLAGGRPLPGGAGEDEYDWNFPTAGLVPGVELTVTADWSAHTGNGLSTGYDKATKQVKVPLPAGARKFDAQTKCLFERLSRWDARYARDYRAAARALSACAACRDFLNHLARMNEDSAEHYHRLALDPPDPNFTVVPTASAPAVAPVVAGSGVSAEAAAAANDHLRLAADAIGQARAALAAVERAQGARLAGDSTWETRQSQAAAEFLKGLATRQGGLPASLAKLGGLLRAGGFPNPTITDAGRTAVVHDWIASGSPDADWLRQEGGLTDTELAQLPGLLAGAKALGTGPVPLLDTFANADLTAASTSMVTALTASAAALLANPLLDLSGQAAPNPTATTTVGPTSRAPAAAEGASLLGNSGFETPALARGTAYQTVSAGKPPGLGAWTIKQGSVDVVAAPGAQAATGGQFVDLNGNDTANGPGVISQDAAVSAGHRYRLSFQLAGNPNGDPPQKTVKVNLGAQEQTFTFDTKGHTNDDLGWTTFSMEGCADTSILSVIFASTTQGQRGPNLDNVVLADLGSCSSGFPFWWLLIAVLLLAAATTVAVLYLRRRRAAHAAPGSAEPPAVA